MQAAHARNQATADVTSQHAITQPAHKKTHTLFHAARVTQTAATRSIGTADSSEERLQQARITGSRSMLTYH
jgi:hypothetical protein